MNRRDRLDQPHDAAGRRAARRPTGRSRSTRPPRCCTGKRVVVLASPNSRNEALFLLERVDRRDRGRRRVPRAPRAPRRRSPVCRTSSLRAERAANATGRATARLHDARDAIRSASPQGDALLVARRPSWRRAAMRAVSAGRAAVGDRARRHHAARGAARHASTSCLPIANLAEEEGTFTNLRGRVQRFLQAKAAPGWRGRAGSCWPTSLSALRRDAARSCLATDVFAALAQRTRAVRRAVATTRSACAACRCAMPTRARAPAGRRA